MRQFVVERGLAVVAAASAPAAVKDGEAGEGSSSDETDPDDEEIVFVGRNGRMRDGKPWKKAERQVGVGGGGEKGAVVVERGMVLDAMEEGDGGAFKCVFSASLLLVLTPFSSFITFDFLLSIFSPPPPLSFVFSSIFPVSPPSFARPITDCALQALAHAFHLGLLRPRLQVGHGRQPCAPRRLRRCQAEHEAARPAAQAAQSAYAAAAAVGDVLRGLRWCDSACDWKVVVAK